MTAAIIIGVVLGIILIFVITWISLSNSIKVAALKVDEALSGIDVALTKRYDTLTKMLDVVRGYREHELATLTQITAMRSGMSMSERNMVNGQMDQLSGQIRILAENYPELRSNTNFLELQRTIADVEEHLQASRRLYNANVTAYNTKLVTFPSSMVASSIGAVQREFFVADEIRRQDVRMTF
ncbi:MAG: LemA family protein [Eubacterium sp.]|nr:LemA family protein [Eubacterium sp.]MBR6173207.1 LemA family protein [Eubacterium sp.]